MTHPAVQPRSAAEVRGAPPAPAAPRPTEILSPADDPRPHDVTVPVAAETLRDDWERAKERLRAEFGDLTEDDLRHTEGQTEHLLDRLAQKTGRLREDIRAVLENDHQRSRA